MTKKTRNIIGWVLTALLAVVFIPGAFMKISGADQVVKGAASMGVALSTMKMLGVVEIICFLLFVIPRTGVLGSMLLAAYLGGAIATHLEHAMPVTMPVIIEAVLFITAAVRFPELTTRLMGTKSAA